MKTPHFSRQRERSAVTSLRLLCLLTMVTLPLCLLAQAPAWWSQRGVIAPNAQPNDYAAVNQGQLKQIATQAMLEMEEHFPGGAGTDVRTLVAGWTATTAQTNDYAPVNLGMLKTVAAPFYARLMAVGYTHALPWTGHEASANNYAAANIGQVKNLFAFDFTASNLANDANQDGVADWWEEYYFPGQTSINLDDPAQRGDGLTVREAFQQGLNPNDYYNGHPPNLVKISGDGQFGPPTSLAPLPLVVQAKDSAGRPLANAPVRFSVDSGEALLQLVSSASFTPATVALTDAAGQAHAYVRFPAVPAAASGTPTPGTISVTSVRGNQNGPVACTFTATSINNQTANGAEISPYAPRNVIEIVNPDGSEEIFWENNPDNRDPIPIWRKTNARAGWTLFTTVPAGTTSYKF